MYSLREQEAIRDLLDQLERSACLRQFAGTGKKCRCFGCQAASAALTVSCALWIALGLATGVIEPYPVQESVCGDETEQTDSYWECKTGSELDLTPSYEDEAQTTTAQERG